MKKAIIITGQTATGKTALALRKAQEEKGELINADSRQIYKKLDILTNKDLTDHIFHQRKKIDDFDIGYYNLQPITYNLPIKIWLYDVLDPKQFFSAYQFEQLAVPLMKQILASGKTPIIVGGTYFYIQYLLYQKDIKKEDPNWKLRYELELKTVSELQAILKELCPETFDALNESDRENPRRLMRKIEMVKAKVVSPKINTNKILLESKIGEPIAIEYLGLHYKDKERLRAIINNKIEDRLKRGAIEEVEKLVRKGYTKKDPGMKTNGYPEFMRYLKGEITKEKAIERWKIREYQYAKRQYTFMKRDKNIHWIEV